MLVVSRPTWWDQSGCLILNHSANGIETQMDLHFKACNPAGLRIKGIKTLQYHIHHCFQSIRYPWFFPFGAHWCLWHWVMSQRFHQPQTYRGGIVHWSSAIYPHTPHGKNGSKVAPAAHHCQRILPSRCNKPAWDGSTSHKWYSQIDPWASKKQKQSKAK